ncbi:EthD family reductase [Candidatus Kapabacteria bacterium]|nr:EthD family reductase [Candidatus Kapabacteria bacterium]
MEQGNIKVSVLYPSGEGKTFDMDYYTGKHIPMVSELLGDAILAATVEKGIAGGEPDSAPPYETMANLYFASIESFQTAFGPHAEQIMGDVPNYTNIEPVIQISTVVV